MDIQYPLRHDQREVLHNLRRFNILLAHRRFGKTVLAIIVLIYKSLSCTQPRPRTHYYAPTYAQAKRIAFDYVKHYGSMIPGTTFNEAELRADFFNGSRLQLGSADNPDSSRGIYSDYCVLDEPAQMPPRMWTEVLRPALSDRRGGALFIGTPKGRHGLFYDVWNDAVDLPDWSRAQYKASETGIVDADELESARKTMTEAEYRQEFECDWSAAIKGAYYGEAMNEIEAAGQITSVLHDKTRLVHCAFDLGYADATAIWFLQIDGMRINFIEYVEYTNLGLPDITAELKRKTYNYGRMIVPHDANQHSLSTGETRTATMRSLGWDTVNVTRCASGMLNQEIEKVRSTIPMMWFDRDNCRDGIEALRQYHSAWNDKRGVLSLRPDHDWSSHGADSMRYMVMCGVKRIAGTWDKRRREPKQQIQHQARR